MKQSKEDSLIIAGISLGLIFVILVGLFVLNFLGLL